MHTLFLPIAIIIGQIFLLTQLRFTVWPEMLAYPYLLNRGFQFYNDIIHPYLPLLPYTIYFLGKIIGVSVLSIQIITYLVIFLNGMLFWKIALLWFGGKISTLLLCAYAILSMLFDVNGLWFDLVTVPFILIAFLLYIKDEKLKTLSTIFKIGILLGTAFITKQTSIFFVLSLVIYLAATNKYSKALLLLMSAGLPSLSLLFFFNVSDLWQWGIAFPFFAISNLPGYVLFPSLRQLVILVTIFIPLIFIYKVRDEKIVPTLLWLLPALTFLVPRFDYFHLQPLLPFFVLYLGILVTKIKITQVVRASFWIYLVAVSAIIVRYTIKNLWQPVRFFEPSVMTTAKILSSTITKDEPVMFYNTTANYFVTAKLLPMKPWVDNFPWYMELPGVQENIIMALKDGTVRQVVFTQPTNNGNWELGTYVPAKLDQYVKDTYVVREAIEENIILLKKK